MQEYKSLEDYVNSQSVFGGSFATFASKVIIAITQTNEDVENSDLYFLLEEKNEGCPHENARYKKVLIGGRWDANDQSPDETLKRELTEEFKHQPNLCRLVIDRMDPWKSFISEVPMSSIKTNQDEGVYLDVTSVYVATVSEAQLYAALTMPNQIAVNSYESADRQLRTKFSEAPKTLIRSGEISQTQFAYADGKKLAGWYGQSSETKPHPKKNDSEAKTHEKISVVHLDPNQDYSTWGSKNLSLFSDYQS